MRHGLGLTKLGPSQKPIRGLFTSEIWRHSDERLETLGHQNFLPSYFEGFDT